MMDVSKRKVDPMAHVHYEQQQQQKKCHMCIVSYIIRENLKRCVYDFLIKIFKG